MDSKKIGILITLATVCVNAVFVFTGVTNTVSCTLGKVGAHLQDTAYAAFSEASDTQNESY